MTHDWEEGAYRVNDCQAIGGLAGGPGKRLPSNRWVGGVKNIAPGLGG